MIKGFDLRNAIELVSNQKGLDRDVVFAAIEEALKSIVSKEFEEGASIRVCIDRDTGKFQAFRNWLVVENEKSIDSASEINLEEAQQHDVALAVGDYVEEAVEGINLSRISAHQAKQVMMRIMREAERTKLIERYRKRIGELMVGLVKHVTRDAIILDLGDNAEALLSRSDVLPREIIRVGDQVRCYVRNVATETKGPQVIVTRTDPGMLVALFSLEVPEIDEGIIEIKAAARDPGFRSKIAVKTNDGRIDPIGACVGIKGTRVQAVSGELNGERIDIALWDDDIAQLAINAMAPAEIVSIVVDEEHHSIDIAVAEENLPQAIGRNGQNVRLASELTGWVINVISADEFAAKEVSETKVPVQSYSEQLDVDEEIANILLREGFTSIEQIAHCDKEALSTIDEFDDEIASALQERARDSLLTLAITAPDKTNESSRLKSGQDQQPLEKDTQQEKE